MKAAASPASRSAWVAITSTASRRGGRSAAAYSWQIASERAIASGWSWPLASRPWPEPAEPAASRRTRVSAPSASTSTIKSKSVLVPMSITARRMGGLYTGAWSSAIDEDPARRAHRVPGRRQDHAGQPGDRRSRSRPVTSLAASWRSSSTSWARSASTPISCRKAPPARSSCPAAACAACLADDLDRTWSRSSTPTPRSTRLLETTGVAEPMPIVWTLERPPLDARVRVAAIVTVVDPLSWSEAQATSTRRRRPGRERRRRDGGQARSRHPPARRRGGDDAPIGRRRWHPAAWLLALLGDPPERRVLAEAEAEAEAETEAERTRPRPRLLAAAGDPPERSRLRSRARSRSRSRPCADLGRQSWRGERGPADRPGPRPRGLRGRARRAAGRVLPGQGDRRCRRSAAGRRAAAGTPSTGSVAGCRASRSRPGRWGPHRRARTRGGPRAAGCVRRGRRATVPDGMTLDVRPVASTLHELLLELRVATSCIGRSWSTSPARAIPGPRPRSSGPCRWSCRWPASRP
jgi:hypothetical protein